MLFPNKLANTIDRVFKTENEFKKYSTYYTKTNSSSQNDSTARTYTSSIHKSKKKQNFESQNQTICLFKHNRVLQDQKRRTKERKEINPFTIQVTEPKVIRRFSHDINTLINAHKVPNKKAEKEITNLSLYRDCIKMIDNATQMKSYAKDIINYISSSTLASSTMYNVRNKIKPTSNNNYFDIILNNVIRKVSFYNSTNEELTIESVMNLLQTEGNILKNETDLYMNKYCYIKNFSTYIDINNEGKDIQYLPLINATRPLTKNEYINIEKEINNSNNEQKESKFPIDYTLRAKLGRIDQQAGYQTKKKRNMRRIKKYRPNGEVYYEEEFYTDSEDNTKDDRKLNSNDFIGAGGAQGGIWDTYNKMHNKKAKNIRNSNISDSSIAEGNKKHLVLTSNLKNDNKNKKGKNDTNNSVDMGSKENDIPNSNNEMYTPMLKFVPRNKIVNNNNNNFATLSTKEDSQINSYSRRRRKEDTKKDVKGDLLNILRKTKIKDDKEDKEDDEEGNTINNTKSKKSKKIKIKLDKRKREEKEKNSSIYNDISSIKGDEQRKDNYKDIKREDTLSISNYSGIDNKEDDEEEDDITQYHNKEKSNKGTDVNGKKRKKGKHKKEKSEKVNKSRKDDDEKNNSNNNINNTSKENNSNNENNDNNNCNENIITEENKVFNQNEQVNSDNQNVESNNSNSNVINSSEGGHQKNKSSSIQKSIEESKSPKKKKSKNKSKGKKKTKKENSKNPTQNNAENKEDSKNPQSIIVEKNDSNSNLPQNSKLQSSNLRQSNQQSKNQSRLVKLSPSVVSNNINLKDVTDNKNQDNQQGNVFFDDESPVNTSQHILLKAIDQSPRRTPLTFKKQITRFNSIKSKFYKAEEENDKLLIEGQKKVLEAKKKQFLNRLDKVVQPPMKPDDFSQLSNATKIKDINIIEKIKYEMFNETTEEGKERYLEMLQQINALKKSDVNSYISELEREFEPFQEEIDAIVKSRKIEERLNKFMQHFSEYRMKEINKRNILGDSIRVIDSKFTTSMSEKLYSIQ